MRRTHRTKTTKSRLHIHTHIYKLYEVHICQHEYYYTVHTRYSPANCPRDRIASDSWWLWTSPAVKQMTRIQRSWPLPSMFLLPGRLPECVFDILSSLNTGAKRNVNLNSECNTGKYPRKRGGIGDCKVGKYRNPTGKILMRDYRRTQCTY